MLGTVIKSETRDLDADLLICESATPGPYRTAPCNCGECDRVFLLPITRSGGFMEPNDAVFIVEARTGWPYAIRRAVEAERENDKLRDEVNLLQEQLQQHHRSDCFD